MLSQMLARNFDETKAFRMYQEHKEKPTVTTSQDLFEELLKMISITLNTQGMYNSYPHYRDDLNQEALIRCWKLVTSLQHTEIENPQHLIGYCKAAIYYAAIGFIRKQKKYRHEEQVDFGAWENE